jgi:hypothetical protein
MPENAANRVRSPVPQFGAVARAADRAGIVATGNDVYAGRWCRLPAAAVARRRTARVAAG